MSAAAEPEHLVAAVDGFGHADSVVVLLRAINVLADRSIAQ